MRIYEKMDSPRSYYLDIPPDGHSTHCTCQRCFHQRFDTHTYSRQVTKRIAESLATVVPDDVTKIICWAINKMLLVPLDDTELRRLVDESTNQNHISVQPSKQFHNKKRANVVDGNRSYKQTKRGSSKGVPL